MADRLYQFGIAGFTDRGDQPLFCLAVRIAKAYLHQLVVFQRAVDFPDHGLTQPRIADHDDRFEGMPALAQIAFLVFGQWHNRIQEIGSVQLYG
jgi:hypothetical protein